MLGPTHLPVWRRSLTMVGGFIAVVLALILIRVLAFRDYEYREGQNFTDVLAGGIVFWFLLLVITAQFARFTIPGVRRMERESQAKPAGPTRRTWLVIVGVSVAVALVIRILAIGSVGPVANATILVIVGRYILWPLMRRPAAVDGTETQLVAGEDPSLRSG
jgi:hypothetical protein